MVESLLIESLLRMGPVDCNFHVHICSISKRSHRKTYNAYAIIASTAHALHFLSKITEINILTMSKALNHYFHNYSGVFIQIEQRALKKIMIQCLSSCSSSQHT